MEFTKKGILRNAEEENVKYIRLMFTDIHGVIKNVEIPSRILNEALDNQIMFDGSSIDGFVRIQEADMYLRPDLDTWMILSWEQTTYGNVAMLICDVYLPNGKPFVGDPRGVLKRNLNKMYELGYSHFNIGVEPEFFLFKLDDKGEPTLEAIASLTFDRTKFNVIYRSGGFFDDLGDKLILDDIEVQMNINAEKL